MSASASSELSRFVWETRYRNRDAQPVEATIEDTWNRVANAVAAIEQEPRLWRERFLSILREYRFLPGGRILAGAGTARQLTLFNCFVMGTVLDSVEGIFEALKEGALTIQQGGGVGYDFSTLRPRGSRARTSGAIASGPVSFMRVWDAMCATILGTGARRGAMMGTLRCDHPDIEEFLDAKRDSDALSRFNLSVLITDAFMEAVRADADWPLVFPETHLAECNAVDAQCVERTWSGNAAPTRCRIAKHVRARELWDRMCASAYDCSEPGLLFIDRINENNNLGYCEVLGATNPCAEEPLPPYGACNLGSINLARFVVDPFLPTVHVSYDSLRDVVQIAVRFLDNVIDISRFPLFRQREQAHRSRRIGLGVIGLADALAMLGLRYDTAQARAEVENIMRAIRDTAYEASTEIAREKGPFPALDAGKYLGQPFVRSLPTELRERIRENGIRNSHLLAIAPGGTISLLANNVSGGIEPIVGIESFRRVLDPQGEYHSFQVTDYAYAIWRSQRPGQVAGLPEFFANSDDIAPADHLLMQASVQPFVDGAISKSIALAPSVKRADVPEIFRAAFDLGLKGCTLFRAQARAGILRRQGATLAERNAAVDELCCTTNRGSD